MMKICVHNIPGYTAFSREVIRHAKKEHLPVEWSAILYSNSEGFLPELQTLLGPEQVLNLQDGLNAYMDGTPEPRLDEMKNFPGSIFQCVSTSKVQAGTIPLQKKPRSYQLRVVAGTYHIYKAFLLKHRPDYVLFYIIELYDSMILYHLCLELGITPVIYCHSRNLGVSYFTDSLYETLPTYAFTPTVSVEAAKKAVAFVNAFRTDPKIAAIVPQRPEPHEIIDTSYLREGLPRKALRFLRVRLGTLNLPGLRRYVLSEPHVVDRFTLLHNMRIHFISVTRAYRRLKSRIHRLPHDISSVDALPDKFVYYPLQYTPESSINTPAPFFVDQLRAIDLIRGALPADHVLVVREHPAMVAERPFSFFRSLQEKAGVLIADPAIPSLDIVRRSALTISVTGTSCLEAFLFGKPSLHLGRAFFTDWICRFDCMSDLREQVRSAIETREVPFERIVDMVARVFHIGSDFVVYAAGGGPFGNIDLLMNTRNIRAFVNALQDHIANLRGTE